MSRQLSVKISVTDLISLRVNKVHTQVTTSWVSTLMFCAFLDSQTNSQGPCLPKK